MLWLLDEPFTALDGSGRRLVRAMLACHLAAGGMAVVSTHHPLGLPDDIALWPLRLG
jgi:heme exporter protein A